MSLGNPELDQAHQALFDAVAQLARAGGADFAPGFAALVERLETEFRLEEDAMLQLSAPLQRAHRAEHARLLGRLHHAAAALDRDDPQPARTALQELPQWLTMHIESMDITLANAMPPAAPSIKAPPMFKHILLPADTSAASAATLRAGMQFARQTGARVTIVHVLPVFRLVSASSELLGDSLDQYQRDRVAQADAMLAELAASARALGLECSTVTVHGDHTDRSIIEASTQHGCDLIAMASHGHLNLIGAMLGSVTHKVLVHSAVPVLVLR